MAVEQVSMIQRMKVHSLVDKVYKLSNLHLAWKKVKENRGAGGIDAVNVEVFDSIAESELEKLHRELRSDSYFPMPVRMVQIPKRGKPKEMRPLGIPAIRDRVCQQALKNRLEPIFEPVFNDCSFTGVFSARCVNENMARTDGGVSYNAYIRYLLAEAVESDMLPTSR